MAWVKYRFNLSEKKISIFQLQGRINRWATEYVLRPTSLLSSCGRSKSGFQDFLNVRFGATNLRVRMSHMGTQRTEIFPNSCHYGNVRVVSQCPDLSLRAHQQIKGLEQSNPFSYLCHKRAIFRYIYNPERTEAIEDICPDDCDGFFNSPSSQR